MVPSRKGLLLCNYLYKSVGLQNAWFPADASVGLQNALGRIAKCMVPSRRG